MGGLREMLPHEHSSGGALRFAGLLLRTFAATMVPKRIAIRRVALDIYEERARRMGVTMPKAYEILGSRIEEASRTPNMRWEDALCKASADLNQFVIHGHG
jgi:hypothetical protein